MNKKKEYPDLIRLPNTNFWKHLLNYWWNRPRVFAEDIYEKYILNPQEEEKRVDLEKITKEIEYLNEILKLQIELSELKKERESK